MSKKKAEANNFLSYNFPHRKKISAFIFIFSFLLGANTLKHSFTLDDEIYYSKNKYAQEGIAGFKDMFTKGSTSGFKETGKKELYRPLTLLSFGLEKDLFDNNSHASHLVQIVLYALCCVALYSLLNIFFSAYHFLIPLLIAILFASHPVHTEVIAGIKNRDELLAFLFSMLALRQFVLMKDVLIPKKILFGLFFLFCAFLSKESSVMMVAVIPLTLYYFSSLSPKKIMQLSFMAAGVFLVYFCMRIIVIPFSTITQQPDLINNSLMAAKTYSEMSASAFFIIGKYIQLVFIPYPLSYDYSFNQVPVVTLNNFYAIISILICAGLIIYSVLKIKNKDLFSYGILFFMLTFFLSSNLLIKIDATIGLRFLFTPLLGFCIAIVFIFFKIFKADPHANLFLPGHKKVFFFFIPLIICYVILTVTRNADWKDNFTLFSHDVKVCPNSTRIHSSLAFEYAMKAMNSPSAETRKEFLERSVEHYKRSVEIYPQHPDAFYNLGIAYYNLGDKEKAVRSYWKAAEINPELKEPLKELGGMYYNDHRNDSALYYFRKALMLDPSDAQSTSIVNYLEGKSN